MKKFLQFLFSTLILSVTFSTANAQCSNDCVWPGDANSDGIVNNLDFIYTGVIISETGIARPLADQGIDWNAKNSTDWGTQFGSSGIDYKHADANGGGWVDGTDLYNPQTNLYDTTNSNYTGATLPQILGNDLFLVFDRDSALAGDTITIGIHLGRATNPINNIHGIAFSIDFDTSKIVEQSTQIDFHGGWLGTPMVDLFTTQNYKPLIDPRQADFGATRGQNGPISGFGEIGQIIVVTEIDLAGKGNGLITSINFDFENVLGLDSLGADKSISYKNDSVAILDGITSLTNKTKKDYSFEIFPNPNRGGFQLNLKTIPDAIAITDILGRKIAFENSNRHIKILDKSKGIYFVHIYYDGIVISKKIIVEY